MKKYLDCGFLREEFYLKLLFVRKNKFDDKRKKSVNRKAFRGWYVSLVVLFMVVRFEAGIIIVLISYKKYLKTK